MSKLNPTIKNSSIDTSVRLAGGDGAYAAKETNIQQLRRVVLANLLWEDSAYIDGKTTASIIQDLIPKCKPEDVANVAVEARVMQKLRHTPLFIVNEMAKYNEMKPYVKEILPKIITRADMLTDYIALYWKDGKKPIPNCVKKGIAEAFHNFNEYHFAKYDKDTTVKLRDVMFMCHPKARTQEEIALYKKIAERNLSTPDTWEVAISSTQDKKAEWTRLIEEKKLGGLAFLRNMNNFKQNSVDKKVIKNGLKNLNGSMLLPLDYLKAAEYAPEFKKEISDSMVESYKKLPKLPGRTLFIVDCSGSMGCTISYKSKFTRQQVANAMAMLAANQCEDYELVCTAGNDSSRTGKHQWLQYSSTGFDLLEQINTAKSNLGGGGIFTRQVLEWCKSQPFANKGFDRIIVFSDSQDCDYPDMRTPNPFGAKNYICDVSSESHGVNYKGKWTAEITGWSEHFLTYIAALEGIQNTFNQDN